jgi:two-component system CheB/CheR fusion protein
MHKVPDMTTDMGNAKILIVEDEVLIAADLDFPGLAADARTVLRTLVFVEKQIATHDGRWFLVRIMPYRTMENRIDGVVITFTNITVAKTLEAKLRQTLAGAGKRTKKGKP